MMHALESTRLLRSLAMLIGVGLPPIALAEYLFVAYPIPVHVEGPDKGLFVELNKTLAESVGIEIRIDVMPPPRALLALSEGSHEALFPALDVLFPLDQLPPRTAEPIDCKEDFVFTRRGETRLRTLEDLRGKTVAITRGYPYAPEVTSSDLFEIEEGRTDEINLQKLIAGRVDAFVLDEKTGIEAIRRMGIADLVQYDPSVPVSRQEVYIAFRDTERGRALAVEFSNALAQLKHSGRYAQITRGITFEAGCAQP